MPRKKKRGKGAAKAHFYAYKKNKGGKLQYVRVITGLGAASRRKKRRTK